MANTDKTKEISPKSRLTTFLLCTFLGIFGAHRFYVGKSTSALAQIFFGWLTFFIWTFIDWLLILTGYFKDVKGRKIKDWKGFPEDKTQENKKISSKITCSDCGKALGLNRYMIKGGCLCSACLKKYSSAFGLGLTLDQIKERHERSPHCVICNKRSVFDELKQLKNGKWVCSSCSNSNMFKDEYIHLTYDTENIKPKYIIISREEEIKKMFNWASNFKDSKSLNYEQAKENRLKEGLNYLSLASEMLNQKKPDYLQSRLYYIKGVEAIRQYNALNNFEYCVFLQIVSDEYCKFVIEIDTFYRRFLDIIIPKLRETPDVLQKDFYNLVDLDKDDISYALYFAEIEGLIKREKKGNSYKLFLSDNEINKNLLENNNLTT
ncbi:MAG TPA: TM2 domain-containing protein [Spirochaetota bacterium]|nr:TM2 domain-containing protein [Spirochaetota bacterium]